jgi:hypothetical protein
MAAAAFQTAAQRRGNPVIGGPANPVVPGVAQPLGSSRPAAPGLWHGGHGQAFSQGQAFRHHQSSTGTVAPIPYIVPVPVYVGGSYDQGIPPSEDPSGPAASSPFPPPIMVAPPVGRLPAIIDGHLQNSEPEPASPPERACPQPERADPVQFFIAMKDGWVTIALAYWIREGTLHYITLEGSHNMVSLELVDRPKSARLNEGGRAPFILPP